jgi:NAD dependent epimerase/dehydratase
MRLVSKGIDTVFHLAALIAIPYSYQAPSSYVDTNVQGTLNVLQAALDCGVRRVIHTSTSEVYGTARFVPISEEHPLQAQSPYSATKIAADALAFSYFSSFELPVTIARPFNTFGPRQSARAVIPTVISQLLAGQRTLKLGSITPTRDFNFVLDTCAGFLALAECEAAIGQTVNIGSGGEISIGDTVKLIARILDVNVEIECDEQRLRPAASEVERLCCDNRLIQALTGHRPAYDLEAGLRATVEWLRLPENFKRYKPDLFNV